MEYNSADLVGGVGHGVAWEKVVFLASILK
jgi:hypothetical protein